MDYPYVMNVEQVKKYLGITDTAYDDQIETFLPVTSAAVIEYLGNDYLISGTGEFTDNDPTITNASDLDGLTEGAILYSESVPDGNGHTGAAEITALDIDGGTITLSANANVTGNGEYVFRVLPLGTKATVAQMVLFRINGGSVKGANGAASGGVKSEKYGPVSVSYGEGSEIGSSGFSKAFEAALWPYKKPRFT